VSTEEYLQQLLAQGIEITLHENGRDLRFRARPGSVTPEFRTQLAARKEAIISHLANAARGLCRGGDTSGLRLSAAQRRLWIQDQLGGAPNNLAGAVRLRGPLDVAAMSGALKTIFARHEAFHTRFRTGSDGEPVQDILPAEGFEVPYESIEGTDIEALRQRITALAREAFDLASGVLLRAAIFCLGDKDHVLFVNVPHIAADGVSLQIFDRELADLYHGKALPAPELRYADYAQWEREREEAAESLDYWVNELSDAPLVSLRPDLETTCERLYSASDCTLPLLDKQDADRLKQFGREHGATPFMTLLAAFGLFLWRATGEDDFALATAITNRPRQELQGIVGFFLNIIALRVRPSKAATFGELLDAVRQTALGAYRHQELPFERIVERLQPERAQGRNPISRIAFAVGDTPWMPGHTLELSGIELAPVQIDRGTLDFDLHCWISDDSEGLTGRLEFRTDLYRRETVVAFLSRFRVMLRQLVGNLDKPLKALDAVTADERTTLLNLWSGSPASASEYATIPEAFGAMAARFPDRTALEFGEDRLTYRELDLQSGALAGRLIDNGVCRGDVVALLMPRSARMVVSMLAVLKAGGAYLPIDPGTPPERLDYLLADSCARLLLLDDVNLSPLVAIPVVPVFDGMAGAPLAAPVFTDATDLAYVIYTSGSTGQPKGVCVPHRAVCRLVHHTNYISIGPEDRIAQAANAAFDAATFEVWGALLNGAAVVGIERQISLNPSDFAHTLEARGITVLFVTTALFNLLARECPGPLAKLRYLLFGGERVDVDAVRALMHSGKPEHLLHVYGPTENTTFSTWHPVTELPDDALTVSIGKALTGTSTYVLSQDGALVPPGTPGELYLGGDGLADGYLNQSELTAGAFVAHPFQAGERLYRTGDIVRYDAKGDIEFIGRRDSQIKLRGFRIELGEIEAALLAQPGVQAVVVVVEKTGASLRIIAYAVSDTTSDDLRAGLERTLPDYMVPGVIILLPELPLNRNGKVDRSLLPAAASVQNVDAVPPRDHLEQAVAEIWQGVISCGPLGVHEHFFDAGGHSLLATQVASRVSAMFGVDAVLGAVFEYPTVAKFTAWLRGKLAAGERVEDAPLVAIPRGKPLLLSSAQQRLWFLDQLTPGTPAYNIPFALRIRGHLRVDAMERAIAGLVARHESLRTRFVASGGHPVQVIGEEVPAAIPASDLRELPLQERERRLSEELRVEALRSFDLSTGPLLRTHLYRMGDEDWVLGLTLHHIIADGWSLGVLRRDLSALYNAALRDVPAGLAPLSIQYADFSAWQRARIPSTDAHLEYWKQRLAGLERLHLPLDFPRPAVAGFEGAAHRFTIGAETLDGIRKLSREQNATLYMTLLTAFAVQLSRYSRQNDFAIGSPIANRQQAALENLIGFFVNTLVMRCGIDPQEGFADMLRRMRGPILEAYAHQDLPFERLVEELDPERDPGVNPLIQVMFALQNAPESGARFADVEIEPLEYIVATTRFDMELHLWETGRELGGILVYNTALFTPETMARFARCFETLLESIAAEPTAHIAALRMISPQDEAEALSVQAATPYPRSKSIAEVFREQAALRPAQRALVSGGRSMSYAELDVLSERLARRLVEAGVGLESPVVLLFERGMEVVVSILAVLKAGGCYVPLEPDQPAQRLQQILDELKPALLLNHASYERLMGLPDAACSVRPNAGPEDLAYIIYTSGSTGVPKGSRIPQRAVVRLVKGSNYLPFGQDEVYLLASSLAFDASTLELWGALLNGATLAILPPGRAAFSEIGQSIRQHGVTTLWLTAGLFHMMVDERIDDLRGLRHLLAGGDSLSPVHVAKALRALPGLTLVNGYGPTENTTFTCCHVMRGEWTAGTSVPIGVPISNTWVVIVDENLRPVPNGVPGELLAGGDGLARDYFNRPDLTEAKFIANPFPDIPGTRLYRTGDLVRRLRDGNIEFLGRLDEQLKIRGFRVEPGEIEHLLRGHPSVQDAAVRAHGARDKKLVAYVVPAAPSALAEKELLGTEQVQEWQTLFDENLYHELESSADPTFNISGWKSSFNGEPIPVAQMRDWLADFLDTVTRCRPRRVLEIGCGTGMILFRVAPGCESYTGCDFSQSALDYIRRHLPAQSNVALLRREGSDFSGFTRGQFDTVVLNSVVQYFPDTEYLRACIAGALSVLEDGGHIILGDLRSLPLLRAFHAAVEFQRAAEGASVCEWRAQVERAMLEEDELLVSPAFFTALDLPRIASVSFRIQKPTHDNELSKFRYTAIIEVGEAKRPVSVDWKDSAAPDAVEKILRDASGSCIGIRPVVNARLRLETALAALSEKGTEGEMSLSDARRQIDSGSHADVDPALWWQLGERLGWRVDVGWADASASGACGVVFTRAEAENALVGVPMECDDGHREALTSQPLRGKLARALGPKLRTLCQECLPDYMVPSFFTVLPSLPLTANGKVDYRALPAPESVQRPQSPNGQAGAQNATEELILAVWLEVLGIQSASVNDNFFDLGGHSLLMVQVCSRLRERLRRDVPVMLMFQHPTIRTLAESLSEAPAAPSIRSSALERARRQRESFRPPSPRRPQ